MSFILEKSSGLSGRHTIKIQRPWFSSDGQRDVTLEVLQQYIGSTANVIAALAENPAAARVATESAKNDLSNPEAQNALLAATSSDVIASKLGEELCAALSNFSGFGDNAGTGYLAKVKQTASTITVRTTTGYARLINSNGSLGAQAGTGVAGSNIALAVGAGEGLRALGILSVANGGSVQSGSITSISASGIGAVASRLNSLSAITVLELSSNQLTSFSGAGLNALTALSLADNQLTTFVGAGLNSLTNLNLINNRLSAFTAPNALLTVLNLDDNQLVSIDLTGLTGGAYTSYATYTFTNNQLSGPALNAAYTSLAPAAVPGSPIDVTGNPGTAADDPTIATAKGYVVIGT